MIYESWPWKQELYKYRKLLDKCSRQKRITEKAYTQIEKSIFFSAFIIRKLIDCATKVSDEVDKYSFHLKAVKPLRNIDRMHRWAEFNDYDWDNHYSLTALGKDICNWLIHSYVFFIEHDEQNKRYFCVCSDFDRNKFLYKVDIDDWLQYIDYVITDSISELHSVYNETKKEYIYIRKKRDESQQL